MTRLFDLDLLNTLVVIAEARSLSAAAPRLGRSQSAISEQIRKLEDMCGLPLLIRSKTGATLTPAGERLVRHARELLAMSDAAYRDTRNARLAGNLRFAITDYFRPAALPGILRRIRDRFPRLHLHVSIRKSAAIEEDVAAGEFDIGLSMTILERVRTKKNTKHHISLRREPLVWVADKSFTMPDDDVVPLVVLPDTCSLQRFVVRTLRARRVPYAIRHSASGVGGLHMAVTAGLGVTCLNASAVPEGAISVDRITRLPALPEVEFGLVAPRVGELPFISEVRDMLAEQLC